MIPKISRKRRRQLRREFRNLVDLAGDIGSCRAIGFHLAGGREEYFRVGTEKAREGNDISSKDGFQVLAINSIALGQLDDAADYLSMALEGYRQIKSDRREKIEQIISENNLHFKSFLDILVLHNLYGRLDDEVYEQIRLSEKVKRRVIQAKIRLRTVNYQRAVEQAREERRETGCLRTLIGYFSR